MKAYDIIDKKRLGGELTSSEIKYFFTSPEIKDYQLSAMLMAITINGMTVKETISLTKVFVDSGITIDLSSVEGPVVDKHSSGGVGDKVSLILLPILASTGIKSCKMSGRGLGLTGGTIDKLESIPGMNLNLSIPEMIEETKTIGMSLASQTVDLVPLDKKIYALRDVTATTESIPLIASSIMSKKIASGADYIFIDLKVGKGAFIKNKNDANYLESLMLEIGKYFKKCVYVEQSNMDEPLGRCVGNKLEVIEAMAILEGRENNNLSRLVSHMAINIMSTVYNISNKAAAIVLREVIRTKAAYKKFEEFIKYQGGNLTKLKVRAKIYELKSEKDGYIKRIDALKIAHLTKDLGAGRDSKEDSIDFNVGIALSKLSGDYVKKGDILAKIYYNETYPDINLALESFIIE